LSVSHGTAGRVIRVRCSTCGTEVQLPAGHPILEGVTQAHGEPTRPERPPVPAEPAGVGEGR
jgi:hypothetical protein